MTAGRLILILAAAATLAAGAFAGWRWSPEIAARLGVGRPAPQPVAQARPPDPLGALRPELAAMLARPAADAPSPLIHLPSVKPEPFCRSLGRIGFTGIAFRQLEAPMRGWSCVTDLLKPVGGDEGSVSSLFFSARGAERDRVETIRLKLNLIDGATTPAVKAVAQDLMQRLFRGLGWEAPRALAEAIDGLREGRFAHRGVAYDLRKEFGEQPGYNLVVTFPQRLGAGGEGRFIETRR